MLEELIDYEFNNKKLVDEILGLNDKLISLGDTFITGYINTKIESEFVYYEDGVNYYFDIDVLNNLKTKLLNNDVFIERVIRFHLDNIFDKSDRYCDLFKAIIGAIIVDNVSINYEVIDKLINTDDLILLSLDNGLNYYKLIYDWSRNKYKELPLVNISVKDNSYNVVIKLKNIDKEFSVCARSKYLAIINASKSAYEYLNSNSMLLKMSDIVGFPDIDKCINQLQELYVKGFINEPQYKIAMKGSNNGIDVWKCRILIDGYKESFSSEDTSKKNAKRNCAFEMLKYIMEQ